MTVGQKINWVRSQGSKIDLWPKGSAGVEAKYVIDDSILYLLIYGTDSRFDWILHFLPGWDAMAEILYGAVLSNQLAVKINECPKIRNVVIYGHSWGGAIAPIVEDCLRNTFKSLWIYTIGLGPKMPVVGTLLYRFIHRGDIVPYLTPWRVWFRKLVFKGFKIRIGRWKPFWKAHVLGAYIQELWNVIDFIEYH